MAPGHPKTHPTVTTVEARTVDTREAEQLPYEILSPVSSNPFVPEKGFPHGVFRKPFHLRPTVNIVVQVLGRGCWVNYIWPKQKTEMPKRGNMP